MFGLYDRDYSVLTEEEIAERARLYEASREGNLRLEPRYSYLPKAVRHNESLFPNNFIDEIDGIATLL